MNRLRTSIASRSKTPIIKSVTARQNFVHLFLNDGSQWNIPHRWLRDVHPSNYDSQTKQRLSQCAEDTGKVLDNLHYRDLELRTVDLKQEKQILRSTWIEGTSKNVTVLDYPFAFLLEEAKLFGCDKVGNDETVRKRNTNVTDTDYGKIELWENLTDKDLRGVELSMSFNDVTAKDGGREEALNILYRFGILLVRDVPTDLKSQENSNRKAIDTLASDIMGYSPLQTLYASIWSTKSDVYDEEGGSTADSAYSSDALPLHTDMTYYKEPPGLQIFCMTQAATVGGESVFADGFALGEKLRKKDEASFQLLSNLDRSYRSIDVENGWLLEASGPIIQIDPRSGNIVRIRHNDLDRLTDIPPAEFITYEHSDAVRKFYEEIDVAHTKWNSLLNDDCNRLKIKLNQGEMVVLVNQVSKFILYTYKRYGS